MESVQVSASEEMLHLIKFLPAKGVESFTQWWSERMMDAEAILTKHGAILFRGIEIEKIDEFNFVVEKCFKKTMPYLDGNSPRSKLTASVYTSTEYDPSQYITMHNELSYSSVWPSKIMFCCLVPPLSGGETPIADSRKIYKAMDVNIVEEIEKKGVMYIRNLHGGHGIGPSWQKTFETDDRHIVEGLCSARKIEYTWKRDGGLKLVQLSPGIIEHPVTKEKVWFNQIDQFHPSHLDAEIYEAMQSIYDCEEDFPTFVKFGDQTKVSREIVDEIKKTTRSQAISFPWETGDLLLLDNVLFAHGRNPFHGPRKILVSML